jgi:hypothetical protein
MTLVEKLDNLLDSSLLTERRVIGGRIDTLLVFADEDPTRVDWQAVVGALRDGKWPDTSMLR